MSTLPRICFGQQPCGFFPRRFLYAKIATARRLHAELGGEIVFFCHDSDHDPRETHTTLTHHSTGERMQLNFAFANQIQRKWSPAFLKRVTREWQSKTARQLPAYVAGCWVDAFKENDATNVADFCLEMYRRMGLLDNIRVVRSSDPAVRRTACAVDDYFVDVPYQDEVVRARCQHGRDGPLLLHAGGDKYLTVPPTDFEPEQISPSRDTRLRWMQSIVQCTHYITGAGEGAYLNKEETPEIQFINRQVIDRSDEAYTG